MYRELSRRKTSTGHRIKRLLKESGMNQEELAEKLEVSTQTVSDWVNDKRKPIRNKKALAELFNVDVEYIMCEQPERVKGVHNFEKYNPTNEEKQKIQEYIDLMDAITKLLNIKGYDIFENKFESQNETFQYMVNDYVVTASDDIKSAVLTYNLYCPDGTTIELTNEQLNSFVNSVLDYIDYCAHKLKDNNSCND